jgi:excisionase family DNA binding protein
MSEFISARQAAARLACSVDHVYDLLDRGQLVEFRDGRRRKVVAASVENYIYQKMCRPPPQVATTERAKSMSPSGTMLRAPPGLKETLIKLGTIKG